MRAREKQIPPLALSLAATAGSLGLGRDDKCEVVRIWRG